jgi:hypothetical protein
MGEDERVMRLDFDPTGTDNRATSQMGRTEMATIPRMMGLAALLVTLGLGTNASAQDVKPNAVQSRAQQNVVDGAARLTRLAYVTSKSHTKVEYVKGNVYRDDSFELTYRFSYLDSDNDPQTYSLRFEYDKRGAITNVVTLSHSSFWEPFNALIIANGLLEGVSKELNK